MEIIFSPRSTSPRYFGFKFTNSANFSCVSPACFRETRIAQLSQDTDGLIGQFLTYNKSEFIAFNSGPALSAYFAQLRQKLPDSVIGVCAHSMGNIAMMESLRLDTLAGRSNINNYVLMQAAVPAHCYQTNYPNYSPFTVADATNRTPDTYRGYPGLINHGVRQSIFNFWNTNDFALATGTKFGLPTNWEQNQIDYKPDFLRPYSSDGTNGFFGVLADQTVSNPREIMACVARPRSKAVGAAGVTGGVFTGGDVNLNASFGFNRAQREHSAQFNFNSQQLLGTGKFYDILITDLLSQ